jgi:hypothetical protein
MGRPRKIVEKLSRGMAAKIYFGRFWRPRASSAPTIQILKKRNSWKSPYRRKCTAAI